MKQIHPLTLTALFFMSASMIIGAAEPDDSFDLATPIASGGAISETLIGHNDVDFYRIEGIDQGHFQVTLTNLAGNFRLQLYNPDRKWLETSDNSELFDELIDRDVWGAGTYYLIVDSNGRAVDSGAYTISVTYQPGFERMNPTTGGSTRRLCRQERHYHLIVVPLGIRICTGLTSRLFQPYSLN